MTIKEIAEILNKLVAEGKGDYGLAYISDDSEMPICYLQKLAEIDDDWKDVYFKS